MIAFQSYVQGEFHETIIGMSRLHALRVKIFADGADLASILKMYANPLIKGFTTNPTLMRMAGVTDYELFARKLLEAVPDRPVSLEVFADDYGGMVRQAKVISSWGANVNVKIPVWNTQRKFMGRVIRDLSESGVVVNVTAVMTLEQVWQVTKALAPGTPAIVSVFAGRIADTGVDPVPLMRKARDILAARPKAELLWASPRELLNVFQADAVGCHIITATNAVLAKLNLVDLDLDDYSHSTVEMFRRDAMASGYEIASPQPFGVAAS